MNIIDTFVWVKYNIVTKAIAILPNIVPRFSGIPSGTKPEPIECSR